VAEVEEPEAALRVKSWPVPLKVTVWVLPVVLLLLSVIVSVPVSAPPLVGEKVTLIVQVPAAATLLPQLLVWAKLALTAMPATASAALPELDSVAACELVEEFTMVAAKVSEEGETPATGAEVVPVPVKLTVWVLPETPLLLSVRVREPVRVPAAVGLKVTLMMQESPAVTLLPQLLVSEKSPLTVMLATASAALPVLLRVTVWGALVVPVACEPNVRLGGATPAIGSDPMV
jgi:hypothetical protein